MKWTLGIKSVLRHLSTKLYYCFDLDDSLDRREIPVNHTKDIISEVVSKMALSSKDYYDSFFFLIPWIISIASFTILSH